jgi:hypothetical protein
MAYDKKKAGEYKLEIVDLIEQGQPLGTILRDNEHLPSKPVVYAWLNKHRPQFDKDFADDYARAREASADRNAERIEEISEMMLDETNPLDPARARVAMDALKWIAGKKRPKKYGDKVIHEGGDEAIKHTIISLGGGTDPNEIKKS